MASNLIFSKLCFALSPHNMYGIQEGKDVKYNNFNWNIITSVNCETFNSVYMLTCTKGRCRGNERNYIGETERKLKDGICEHLGYINTKKTNKPAGYHFNIPGHNRHDLKVLILEKQLKMIHNTEKKGNNCLSENLTHFAEA